MRVALVAFRRSRVGSTSSARSDVRKLNLVNPACIRDNYQPFVLASCCVAALSKQRNHRVRRLVGFLMVFFFSPLAHWQRIALTPRYETRRTCVPVCRWQSYVHLFVESRADFSAIVLALGPRSGRASLDQAMLYYRHQLAVTRVSNPPNEGVAVVATGASCSRTRLHLPPFRGRAPPAFKHLRVRPSARPLLRNTGTGVQGTSLSADVGTPVSFAAIGSYAMGSVGTILVYIR